MSCLLSKDKAFACADKSKQGGLDTVLWLYNLEEGGETTTYTEVDMLVSAFTLPTGAFLRRVDTDKFASSYAHSFAKPSLNTYFPQTLNIASLISNAEDLSWLVNVLNASKLGAVVKDNNGDFKILGQYAGLSGSEGDLFDSGNEIGAAQATTAVLTGGENDAPFKYFSAGDVAATTAYLVALEETI